MNYNYVSYVPLVLEIDLLVDLASSPKWISFVRTSYQQLAMAGVKRKSDATQSSSNSKPAKKAKLPPPPAKPFKSAEIVVESDSNDEAPRGRSTTRKPTTSSTEETSRVSSVLESSTRPTQPKPIVHQSDPAKSRKYESPALSSTSSDNSGPESGSESENGAHKPQAKKKDETSESETNSDSSDEEEEDSDDDDEDPESDEDWVELQRQQQQLLVLMCACVVLMAVGEHQRLMH